MRMAPSSQRATIRMMHEMASADTPLGKANPAPILDEPNPSCQINGRTPESAGSDREAGIQPERSVKWPPTAGGYLRMNLTRLVVSCVLLMVFSSAALARKGPDP